jgi:hypothetical protein
VRCVKCGFDPEAIVLASWTFTLEIEAESLNAHRVNAGSNAARARYRKARNDWGWLVKRAKQEHRIPMATGMRRLTLTRIYESGQRRLDKDNLVGGFKPLLDEIRSKDFGLIRDDSPVWSEIHYLQEPGDEPAVRVLLEDLGGEPALAAPRRARREGARR